MLGRAIAKDEVLAYRFKLSNLVAKKLAQPLFGAPKRRRLDAGRRCHVLTDGLENLADKPIRRPVRQANASAWPTNSQQLASRLGMVRREHCAESGEHHVE